MKENDFCILSEQQYREFELEVANRLSELEANIKPLSEKDLNDARGYALCIIFETKSFREFAIAMMDYLGLAICPHCKAIYKELYQVAFTQKHNMLSPEIVDGVSESEMKDWFCQFVYDEILHQHEKEKLFKENIDELQFLVKEHRQSREFQKMLDFVGRFHYLAPYNAMLVEMQKPGATFVFSGRKWKKYGRRPKPNAQQLITLVNFGPVQCLFDFSDTEPIPGEMAKEETELMEMWDSGLKGIQGSIDERDLNTLIQNLPSYGVYLDDSFLASNTYGGYIKPYLKEMKVPLNKTDVVTTQARFLISVNHKQTKTEKFHTICHELGHLFCNHLSYDVRKMRTLTLKEREFEAETVAWLVCKRRGLMNPSEEYLATYSPHGEIPICSTEFILKAVTEIEKMLKDPIYASKSLWYRDDKIFKAIVEDATKKLQKMKKKKEEKLFHEEQF
ncbi:MAG: ImmA/IrrE family metallo-endopeptidase [Prevotella sp.]|nr:ImmA/IrrE family metallo-endopeptidase [Prevotella sp.]